MIPGRFVAGKGVGLAKRETERNIRPFSLSFGKLLLTQDYTLIIAWTKRLPERRKSKDFRYI